MIYIFGIHAALGMFRHNPDRIIKLIIDAKRQDDRLQQVLLLARQLGIPIEHVDKSRLGKCVGEVAHQGVVIECRDRKKMTEADLDALLNKTGQTPFLVILDEVQDPHNLGACLRTADAAGVHAVIAPKDNSAGITAVTEKVASGAAETVPFIQVTNLARTMRSLKDRNIWLYGLADEAEASIYQADLKGAIALVLGAEGSGIRQNTLKQCDAVYAIPMNGFVSSLNVSVAAGICMYEALRQRVFIDIQPISG